MAKMKKRSILNFQVLITQDEDGMFVAVAPAIPGCHAQGSTYEEALVNIKDAMKLCLEVAKKDVKYRKKIDWPESKKNPKLLGIINIPIPSSMRAE